MADPDSDAEVSSAKFFGDYRGIMGVVSASDKLVSASVKPVEAATDAEKNSALFGGSKNSSSSKKPDDATLGSPRVARAESDFKATSFSTRMGANFATGTSVTSEECSGLGVKTLADGPIFQCRDIYVTANFMQTVNNASSSIILRPCGPGETGDCCRFVTYFPTNYCICPVDRYGYYCEWRRGVVCQPRLLSKNGEILFGMSGPAYLLNDAEELKFNLSCSYMNAIESWQIDSASYGGSSLNYYTIRNGSDPLYITTYPGITVSLRALHAYLPFTNSVEYTLLLDPLDVSGNKTFSFVLNTTDLAHKKHEIPSFYRNEPNEQRPPFIIGGRLYLETTLTALTGQIRLPGTQKNFYMDFENLPDNIKSSLSSAKNSEYLSASAIPGGLGTVLCTGVIILLGFLYTIRLAVKMPRGKN